MRSKRPSSSAAFSSRPPAAASTCSGANTPATISAISAAEAGAEEAGFNTAVFPAATAAASGPSESRKG